MLIIDKQNKKDYYDGIVQTFGIDKTHVFNRSSEIIEFNRDNYPTLGRGEYPQHTTRNNTFEKIGTKKYPLYKPFIIGFCGKIYIGWELTWWEKSYNFTEIEKTSFIYDKEQIRKIIKNINSFYKGKYLHEEHTKILDNFYNHINGKLFPELFFKYNVPYFKGTLGSGYYNHSLGSKVIIKQIITNPLLKEFEFVKLFDPVTTFQEIDMYLFGVLGYNEKEISEVPEKYRMSARGMDKTSFRQAAPGERKEKRKLNKKRKKEKKNINKIK